MTIIAIGFLALYSVLSPSTRSNLSDIALIGAVVVGGAAALGLLLKFWGHYIWRPFRWLWRRAWGRDNTGTFTTPSVRMERWLNGVMAPAIAENTGTMLAEMLRNSQDAKIEMRKLRRENTEQHAGVGQEIGDIRATVQELSDRVALLELAVNAGK